MFTSLAKFAARYKVLIIIIWIVLAGASFLFAPALSKVGVIDDSQFLPQNTESAQAREILKSRFTIQAERSPGSALIVAFDPAGLSSKDEQTVKNIHDWLVSDEAPRIVSAVISIFENEAFRSTLISQDQTTMLMELQLPEASASAESREAVREIRFHIRALNSSTQILVTGNTGISFDLITSVQRTIDKTTLITAILVIVLLLIIYRSPVAILVPLITIATGYSVAKGIIGYIASWGVAVSSLMDAYLVVLLFGIGTDYCLFMVSRFKEEIVHGEAREAAEISFRQIGPVILASAITVIGVLLCLGISRFGMNRTSGFSLAIGVAMTLLASLTLTPALISLFGKKMLWPARFQPVNRSSGSGFWRVIGQQITRKPALFLVPIVVIMAVPYLALPGIRSTAEMLTQMPENMESVSGFNILRSHFPSGETAPAYILVESTDDLSQPDSLRETTAVKDALERIDGVSHADYFAAQEGELRALGQSSRQAADAAGSGNISQLLFFRVLGQNLQSLAVRYPGVTQSENFQQIVSNLTQISAKASQLQSAGVSNATALLADIKQLAEISSNKITGLADEFDLQGESQFVSWLETTYFSIDHTVTRINVVLADDPYSEAAVKTIGKVRGVVKESIKLSSLERTAFFVGGETATQADILAINNSDFLRVLVLAVIGIFVVTTVLLRSLVAPIYMIITVLFNFGATLGISTWLFLDVLKQNSIIYMLPIFVFVILVAVGADYNIFLVSRIKEEAATRSLKEAIGHAVANTGGVITACGIILAGTFGTLMTAPLQLVFQIGAAIAIGVIVDTFLVRAMVIPSIATLIGRWNWWPGKGRHY
jgi:putative drug exporter of the RND superfamily